MASGESRTFYLGIHSDSDEVAYNELIASKSVTYTTSASELTSIARAYPRFKELDDSETRTNTAITLTYEAEASYTGGTEYCFRLGEAGSAIGHGTRRELHLGKQRGQLSAQV